MLLTAKPVEPVSYYPCISPPADSHIDLGSEEERVTAPVLEGE
jgi:hypothetical protein